MADPYYTGGYRNPAIGAAAANLATMFAPPSASDVYGYARAASEKDKRDRANQVWSRLNDPSVDPKSLDALMIGAGRLNHVGVAVFQAGEWWVLHAFIKARAVVLHRVRDLGRQGLTLEGWYRWN